MSDTYNLPKFCAVALFLAFVLCTAVWRAATAGYVTVPSGALGWSLGAFAAALATATAIAPSWTAAVLGTYGRYNGLASYVACVVALIVVARTFDVDWIGRLRLVVVGSAAVVALIALLEQLAHGFGAHTAVKSTIGNADFLAAYLGIAVSLSISTAWDRANSTPVRAVGALCAVLDLVAAALTGALQGLAAAAVGTSAFLVVLLVDGRRRRALWLTGAVAVGVAIVGLVVVGFWSHGPLGVLGRESTMVNRRLYWHTAREMFNAHPLSGVGLSAFGDHYYQYWPVHATHRLGAHRFADAASNVPLTMFAEGGVVLGLAYLAVVGVTAVRVWRTIVAGLGRPPLFAGVVGGWLAFQAQSAVSIDKLTLVILGWVLTGAVLAMTEPPFHELRRRTGLRHPNATRGYWSLIPCAAAMVVLLVPVVALLRADSQLWAARHSASPVEGITHERRAAQIVGWVPAYADRAGQHLLAIHAPSLALPVFERALSASPRDRTAYLGIAAAYQSLGRLDASAATLAALTKIDRHDPVVLEERAELYVRRGNYAAARRAIDRAIALHSDATIERLDTLLAEAEARRAENGRVPESAANPR